MTRHIQLKWVNSRREDDQGNAYMTLPVSIGRALSNDIILADNQAGVSRWHACLSYEDDQIILMDQNSTNGIFVDEEKVTRHFITSGTTFRVGTFELTVTTQNRCSNGFCRKLVDSELQMCPWCGRFLADAFTQDVLFQ